MGLSSAALSPKHLLRLFFLENQIRLDQTKIVRSFVLAKHDSPCTVILMPLTKIYLRRQVIFNFKISLKGFQQLILNVLALFDL